MKKNKDWEFDVNNQFACALISNGADKYCGLEIEFIVPILLNNAEEIMDAIIEKCRDENIQPSEITELSIIKNLIRIKKEVSFINGKTQIWRVVLSDWNNLFPEDSNCDIHFKYQLKDERNMDPLDFLVYTLTRARKFDA